MPASLLLWWSSSAALSSAELLGGGRSTLLLGVEIMLLVLTQTFIVYRINRTKSLLYATAIIRRLLYSNISVAVLYLSYWAAYAARLF